MEALKHAGANHSASIHIVPINPEHLETVDWQSHLDDIIAKEHI